jgi:hypothetical protein
MPTAAPGTLIEAQAWQLPASTMAPLLVRLRRQHLADPHDKGRVLNLAYPSLRRWLIGAQTRVRRCNGQSSARHGDLCGVEYEAGAERALFQPH